MKYSERQQEEDYEELQPTPVGGDSEGGNLLAMQPQLGFRFNWLLLLTTSSPIPLTVLRGWADYIELCPCACSFLEHTQRMCGGRPGGGDKFNAPQVQLFVLFLMETTINSTTVVRVL